MSVQEIKQDLNAQELEEALLTSPQKKICENGIKSAAVGVS